MEPYIRYGISQRLGRFAVTVWVEGIVATIHLNLDDKVFAFIAETSRAVQHRAPDSFWLERAARTAISQTDKISREDAETGQGLMALDFAARPWTGDLRLAPYGGPTLGIYLQVESALRDAKADYISVVQQSARATLTSLTRLGVETHGRGDDDPRRGEGPDRRQDQSPARAVEEGLALQLASGDAAAITYLLGRQIAQHTVVRVLSGARFRRHLDRPRERRKAPASGKESR